MSNLSISIAQINAVVGDLQANTAAIITAIRRAREAVEDIVVFPELALSGYPPEDLLLRPQFLRDCRAKLDEIAAKTKDVTAIVGFPELSGEGELYNSAALLSDGVVAAIYRKVELPNYGVFDEKRYFAAGSHPVVFEAAGKRCLLSICEDLWVEKGQLDAWVEEHDVDLVFNLSASPFHAGKVGERRAVMQGFAKRNSCFVVHANLIGGQDELVFCGGSLVADPAGEIVASAAQFSQEDLVVQIQKERVSAEIVEPMPYLEEIYQALVLGTRDYVTKSGMKKVVLGMSGGIDSALVLAIAVEAFGPKNVVAVSMPSRYSSKGTKDDARRMAKELGVTFYELPIENIYNAGVETLSEPLGGGEGGLELENLQARIRGTMLMTLSNKHGWLLLTTGNKSEMAVGYCTLYGDMNGGYAVIKDVPKMLVFELSRYCNSRAEKEVVPVSIIERPPSAELRPDQKDEDSLPPYEILDQILEAYVERDMSPAEIEIDGVDRETICKMARLVDRAEFKRFQAPPGVKITPKAFGRDRRMPIQNSYAHK